MRLFCLQNIINLPFGSLVENLESIKDSDELTFVITSTKLDVAYKQIVITDGDVDISENVFSIIYDKIVGEDKTTKEEFLIKKDGEIHIDNDYYHIIRDEIMRNIITN
jgi:hypothetical protein